MFKKLLVYFSSYIRFYSMDVLISYDYRYNDISEW